MTACVIDVDSAIAFWVGVVVMWLAFVRVGMEKRDEED